MWRSRTAIKAEMGTTRVPLTIPGSPVKRVVEPPRARFTWQVFRPYYLLTVCSYRLAVADFVTHTARANETRRLNCEFFREKGCRCRCPQPRIFRFAPHVRRMRRSDRTAVEGHPGTGRRDRDHRLKGEADQQIQGLMDDPAGGSFHRFLGGRWRPVLAGSPVIFVFENSHFGHLKTCFSAPLAPGSRLASSIRVRHMAQRGGLTGLEGQGGGAVGRRHGFSSEKRRRIGGRGGIRTHGTLAGTPVFKTGALNRSATLPSLEFSDLAGGWAGESINCRSRAGAGRRFARGVARSGPRSPTPATFPPPALGERESQQARAQQHEAGRGQCEETVGHQVMSTHVAPVTLEARPN